VTKRDHFDWDDAKALSNEKKHGVTFEEAQWAFEDKFALTHADERHSTYEHRYIQIGLSRLANLLVVVHTDESDCIRIISARKATKHEAEQYTKARQ